MIDGDKGVTSKTLYRPPQTEHRVIFHRRVVSSFHALEQESALNHPTKRQNLCHIVIYSLSGSVFSTMLHLTIASSLIQHSHRICMI